MNFLFELRETAKHCSDILFRKLLKDAADRLQSALSALAEDPTRENAKRFNGAWAVAEKVLKNAPPMNEGPNERGGAMREERIAA